MYLVLLGCCMVALLLSIRKRRLDQSGIKPSFGYHFIKNSLELLYLFLFASLTYFVFLLFVTVFSDYASLQFLIRVEKMIETVKSTFSILKLNELTVLGVLVVIYLLGWLRLAPDKSSSLIRLFGKYQTATKRIYIFLILLCSFTLLGYNFGEPAKDLRLKIKLIRDGYADINDGTRQAVPEEITSRIYVKMYEDFPSDYKRSLKSAVAMRSRTASLREQYKSARNRYGIRLRNVESVLAASSPDATRHAKADHGKEQPQGMNKVPQDMSYKEIKEIKLSIDRTRAASKSRVDQLLKTEGGQEIYEQVPKVLTGEVKSKIFGQLMHRYPLLEPVIEVFAKTIDDEIVTRVRKARESVDGTVINSPEKLRNFIDTESDAVLEGKRIDVPPGTMEKAHEASTRITGRLARLANSRSLIDKEVARVENKKTMRTIAQLRSSDKRTRIEAVSRLAGMGGKLSKKHVDEIVKIMRHGKQSWSRSLGRIEGHHCEDFEKVSVKYYAADAILQMKSRYVGEAIITEANKAKENGISQVRVTDPGWV